VTRAESVTSAARLPTRTARKGTPGTRGTVRLLVIA
jgi:hypothetical protein